MKKSLYSIEASILSSWLTNKRKAANLTQRQLAEKLMRHHSIIGKIETGERQINVVELIEYCRAMNCDPNEIITQLNISVPKFPSALALNA